jgi:hypothetical protein
MRNTEILAFDFAQARMTSKNKQQRNTGILRCAQNDNFSGLRSE